MQKTKRKLEAELDLTQEFITACEVAQAHRLGLDEATYDKYNNAVERQKELVELLKSMVDSQNLLRTTAQFHRKEPNIQSDECVVEKIIELSKTEFDEFSSRLLDNYDFIAENQSSMYVDNLGVTHALLVLGKAHEDGILVDSQGSSYARYSAILPNARSFIRQHEQSSDSRMTLWQLMACGLEDVHLVDADVEHEVATIVELNQNTLTDAGRKRWDDVLSTKVNRIYSGYYGTQIELCGCSPKQLTAFSFMLAGHCAENEYDEWVKNIDAEQDEGPAFSM